MRYLAFILAIHFSFFAVQPAWELMASLLPGGCGGETCVVTMACPVDEEIPANPADNDQSKQSCCPPFQCCFPCCCFINQPYRLETRLLTKKKIRPDGRADLYHSQFTGECFHPPEMPGLA